MKAKIGGCGGDRSARSCLSACVEDNDGATIVEFALVAPPFIALLLAILVTSLVFFAQQTLETAGEAAARLILTGQAQQNGWTAAQYKTQVCNQLPPLLNCSKLMVDVETVASFSAASTAPPTITYDANGNPIMPYQTGGAGDIVIVRLMYLLPIATGPLGFNLGNQPGTSNRLLIATSVAQTEPYTS
jgi:Flp pilus assembly protein TadG